MHDPWNPSPDEIRHWAYDADAVEPCQDFDLALEWSRHEHALFQCASDDCCPKQVFFLRVLYLIVGDAVRTDFRSTQRPIIDGFIKRGDEYQHPAIAIWQQRSRELIDHPEHFDYELWCAGGLVRGDRL
jgi:hypothetical protein